MPLNIGWQAYRLSFAAWWPLTRIGFHSSTSPSKRRCVYVFACCVFLGCVFACCVLLGGVGLMALTTPGTTTPRLSEKRKAKTQAPDICITPSSFLWYKKHKKHHFWSWGVFGTSQHNREWINDQMHIYYALMLLMYLHCIQRNIKDYCRRCSGKEKRCALRKSPSCLILALRRTTWCSSRHSRLLWLCKMRYHQISQNQFQIPKPFGPSPQMPANAWISPPKWPEQSQRESAPGPDPGRGPGCSFGPQGRPLLAMSREPNIRPRINWKCH